MKTVIQSLLVMALAAAVFALLVLTGNDSGQLSVTWHGYTLTTTAVVGCGVLFLAALFFYYIGQLASWVLHLPTLLTNLWHGHRQHTTMVAVAEALAARMVGDDKLTARKLAGLHPTATEQPLVTLLDLPFATPNKLEALKTDPLFGAAACLYLARAAAKKADWAAVAAASAQGLKLSPKSPRLVLLHLKALLNGDNHNALQTFLPQAKPLLTLRQWSYLNAAVIGPSKHGAADGPKGPGAGWLKTFNIWLTTPNEIFPDAEA